MLVGRNRGVGHAMTVLTLALCAALAGGAAPAENKVQKLTFTSGDTKGSYYLFVPEKAGAGPAPLVLLLHGSGHDGKSLIDPWLGLAKSEGIVLVAPSASNPQAWRIPQEGPQYFYDLLESVRAAHKEIDERRMYVFGHSAGAIHGLGLGLLESQYFAAVAVHAGALAPEMGPMLAQAPRKIPMAIWVGTNDAFFPLKVVRDTRDALTAAGFETTLTEIPNHTHDYYGSSSSINKDVWKYLQRFTLDASPKYQAYQLLK